MRHLFPFLLTLPLAAQTPPPGANSTSEARIQWLQATAGEGPEAADRVLQVTPFLRDDDHAVRKESVATLVALRPDLAGARKTLLEIVEPPSDDMWNTAIGLGGGAGGVFGRGRNIPKWEEQLESEDAATRLGAVKNLFRYGRVMRDRFRDGTIPKLRSMVDGDPAAEIREYLLRKVDQFGVDEELITRFCHCLEDVAAPVRIAAAETLNKHARKFPDVHPRLMIAVQDPEWQVRSAVLRALGSCKVKDKATVGILSASVRDRQAEVRAAALSSIGRLKIGQERAVQAVGLGLADQDPKVRKEAVVAAGRIGEDALALEEGLFARADDGAVEVRRVVPLALYLVLPESPRTLLVLVERLLDEDKKVKSSAKGRLEKLIHG